MSQLAVFRLFAMGVSPYSVIMVPAEYAVTSFDRLPFFVMGALPRVVSPMENYSTGRIFCQEDIRFASLFCQNDGFCPSKFV